MSTEATFPMTKTFILSLYGQDPVQTFDMFSKLSIVKGKHVSKLLMELIDSFVRQNLFDGTLVEERELVTFLEGQGISVSRPTLKNYRKAGKLCDSEGRPLWFTDGRNICYHKEGCLDFFREKSRFQQYRAEQNQPDRAVA